MNCFDSFDYDVHRTAKQEVTGTAGRAEEATSNAVSAAWYKYSYGWVSVCAVLFSVEQVYDVIPLHWLGGLVVGHRFLTGELLLVCTGPAADV